MTYEEALAQLPGKLDQTIRQARALGEANMPRLFRVEIELPPLNQVSWLMAQDDPVKLFWSARDQSYSVAAIGLADDRALSDATALSAELARMQAILESAGETRASHYYGGVGFDDNESSRWPGFFYGRFVLPLIEILRDTSGYRLACNLLIKSPVQTNQASELLRRRIETLLFGMTDAALAHESYTVLARADSISLGQWKGLVRRMLRLEAAAKLNKVVLSREVQLELAKVISPWSLLEKWRHYDNNCCTYAFHFGGQSSFLGFSPERLFRLRARELETESVAGTIGRGVDAEEDARNEKQLKSDRKVIRENELVRDYIGECLQPLCHSISRDESPSVLKLDRLQHLRYQLRGHLYPTVTVADVLQALHPTPAVGGAPKEPALALIRELEPHRRGWYSGAVGYIGAEETEFAVAIRCALIRRNKVRLYSGAGIVPGSRAEAEWQELESKISTALACFE